MANQNEIIAALKETVVELQKQIDEITNAANGFAAVVYKGAKRSVVATSNGLVSIENPRDTKRFPKGCVVRITPDGMVPVDDAELARIGKVTQIARVDPTEGVYISNAGQEILILVKPGLTVKAGDKVILDPTGSVVSFLLESAQEFQAELDKEVTWDQIVGNTEAKRELREAIEMMLVEDDNVLKAYGYKPPKGILLYGAPGCGKTMLAKACASALGQKGFIHIRGPQILDPYVGVAEATIRKLFDEAKEHYARTGKHAIVFIDEAESILRDRNARRHVSSGMEATIVPAFLAEMDGLNDSKAIVILATNSPDVLDPAITREGRIDRKIQISRPTQLEAAELLSLLFAKTPLPHGVTIQDLAVKGAVELFDDERTLYRVAYADGGPHDDITLGDIASGAMVEAIAQLAATNARRRDMATKIICGITHDDVVEAVKTIYRQNRDVNHDEVIRERAGARKVSNVEKNYAEAA